MTEHNCDIGSDSSQYPVVLRVGGTRTGVHSLVIYIYIYTHTHAILFSKEMA